VVVPAHGPGPYLTKAIETALAERPAEVIVVEDGTEGVHAPAGVRLLRLPHVGRSRARNEGVQAARTAFVAFLDEDDESLPGRLRRQVRSLEEAPAATMSFGEVVVVGADGVPIEDESRNVAAGFRRLVRSGYTFEAVARLGGPLYTSATTVRRDAFLESGGFDSAFDAYEDLDLYLRLARDGALVPCLGGPVTAYRRHAANTHSDALYAGLIGVTAKHLPSARGRERRALLERRIDALWGLGRAGEARREALGALVRDPRLLGRARFVRRAAALAVPLRILHSRR